MEKVGIVGETRRIVAVFCSLSTYKFTDQISNIIEIKMGEEINGM